MKKAGVRFSNDMMISFEYDEQTKDINILVVEGNDRLTGSVELEKAAKTTSRTAKAKATK